MRPSRNLPSSKFRLVAVATFAALAISPTVLGLNSGDSDTTGTPPATAPTTTAVATSTTEDAARDPAVEEVTTRTPSAADDSPTTASSTLPSDEAVADEVVAGIGVDVLAVDAPPGPVSGQPIVVGEAAELSCAVETSDDREPPATEGGEKSTPAEPAMGPVKAAADKATTTTAAPPIATTTGADVTVSAFDTGAAGWVPLSGSWSVVDGEYVQSDATGYDFITQYPGDLPTEYALSVRLRATGDALGGGVMVAQPVPGSRRGATLIDFTDGGRFLRWGRYDADSGQYQYVGGVAMGDAFDTAASHRLTVEVRSGRTLVVVDGAAVGDFGPVGAGRIGLATSLSAVAFDDLEIVTL